MDYGGCANEMVAVGGWGEEVSGFPGYGGAPLGWGGGPGGGAGAAGSGGVSGD